MGLNGSVWPRLRGVVSAQNVAWLLLFSALGAVSPTRSDAELQLLAVLAVVQVVEPRLRWLSTPAGVRFSVLLKLGLGFLLMGVSGGVQSSYYLIMMVPVVSAATHFGAVGALLTTLAACGCYLSFLLWLDWSRYVLPSAAIRELSLRVVFLAMLGYLTHQLVEANRAQARRYRRVADELSEANRSLQEAEAAVRRSERLAALGQLTAGLAHELRNPLGTIRASADMLSRSLPAESTVAGELAGYISSEVDRTNNLVTRFLDFARPMALWRKRVELGEVIDQAVDRFLRRQPPFEVEVFKNYSPDIRPLDLDPDLMESVFYNLLINAAEASPPGAPITIKTRPAHEGAEVTVIDRGSGIEAVHLENIFNPFFTTKPSGIGLGLAIVSKIVDEHGGTMSVESQPGEGSVFRIFLPSGE